jgi:uncharacterized protein YgiM (DUF1202 family)
MKRARVLMWVIGVLTCVISILLFTSRIDVFDRDDQPTTNLSEAPPSPPAKEAARLAPTEISAQNSPHAITPDTEPPAAAASPATETKSPAIADPIEVQSPAAPKDEFVTITETVTIRNGPSASADVIGRAHAGARARVASRDSGWSQIVDPASGNTGWVDSSVLVPSPTPETVAAEESAGETPDATLNTPLEDQSSQITKKTHSATRSRQAAKAEHHRANHNYGRRRFAFRFFFRGFLR